MYRDNPWPKFRVQSHESLSSGLSVAKTFESGNRMVTDFPTDGHNVLYRSLGIISTGAGKYYVDSFDSLNMRAHPSAVCKSGHTGNKSRSADISLEPPSHIGTACTRSTDAEIYLDSTVIRLRNVQWRCYCRAGKGDIIGDPKPGQKIQSVCS